VVGERLVDGGEDAPRDGGAGLDVVAAVGISGSTMGTSPYPWQISAYRARPSAFCLTASSEGVEALCGGLAVGARNLDGALVDLDLRGRSVVVHRNRGWLMQKAQPRRGQMQEERRDLEAGRREGRPSTTNRSSSSAVAGSNLLHPPLAARLPIATSPDSAAGYAAEPERRRRLKRKG